MRPAAGRAGPRATLDAAATLAGVFERDVIPRLLLARGDVAECLAKPPPCPGDAEELAAISLKRDPAEASAYVAALRAAGAAAETLYLGLLAPAARRLGDLWVQDLCDFAQVTIGLVRLQGVLHELSPDFQANSRRRRADRRAVLVTVPGEPSTFGLSMLVEFFVRAGWTTWSEPVASTAELVRMARARPLDLVGFSVSCDRQIGPLTNCIRAVRRASRNPALAIMVGGPVFLAHPDLALHIGADATAADGKQATERAEGLVCALRGRHRIDGTPGNMSESRETPALEGLSSRENSQDVQLPGAGARRPRSEPRGEADRRGG